MKIKQLGRTGLKVSEICLGTMTFGYQCDDTTSFSILDTAWSTGINFIDTADVYPLPPTIPTVGKTELIIGNWLKSNPGRRHELILATKCNGRTGLGPNDHGLSRRHIMDAIDNSLRRLQTDFIDLYQVHFYDPETPIDETLRTLDDIVRSGKARYIGCSNYLAYQLSKALWISDKLGIARYDCIQPRYNLLFREFENELFPLCKEEKVGVIVYNPLAGGFLTGKHDRNKDPETKGRFDLGESGKLYQNRYWHDTQFDIVDSMKEFFSTRNKTLTSASLAWVLSNPVVTSAIVGASKPGQLTDSLQAINIKLDETEMEFLNSLWYRLPRIDDPAVALR
jgi:aryl-alcohol dehydrogenase-like predicted oxidoreductase